MEKKKKSFSPASPKLQRGEQRGPVSRQGGQILLIVILAVIVLLTVGLSLASRTVINLRSSTEEAESQKALAAAEAGIERALQGNVAVANPDLGNNSNYIATVVPVNGAEISLNGGSLVPKDDGIDVWFEGHNAAGDLDGTFVAPSSLTLYWGSSSDCAGDVPSAIQVIVVTETKIYRYAYDSCNRGNNFTTAESGSYDITTSGIVYNFKNKTPDGHLASGIGGDRIVFMRVVPIYKDTIIGVKNGSALPSQGYKIESTGISGQANRKIAVFKGYPQIYLPYISYGLFVVAN